MGENSKISWTDHTFNPWIGCTKVSPGCKFCYAEVYTERYFGNYWGGTQRHKTAESTWKHPLTWNRKAEKEGRRRRVFCGSLMDIMDDVPMVKEWREQLWPIIEQTPMLDWLLLTKRPQNYLTYLPDEWHRKFPKNVWLGASVCTQIEYNKTSSIFLEIMEMYVPLGVTFFSVEPMLGPVRIKVQDYCPDWLIIGGESGFLKDARPMDLQWVKYLIQDIDNHFPGADVFVKQLGSQLAKTLKMADSKGEHSIDSLGPQYDWLKRREIPVPVSIIKSYMTEEKYRFESQGDFDFPATEE